MNRMTERRRSKRFHEDSIAAQMCMVRRRPLETEPCALMDLSFGGMCYRTPRSVQPGETHCFLLDLEAPFNDLVMVKARVKWSHSAGQECVAGVEFTESTKGWLGPEE